MNLKALELRRRRKTKKNTLKAIDLVKERGGNPLFETVNTTLDKFNVECINGHTFETCIDYIQQGSWCKQCSGGLYERICRAYFEQIFDCPFPNTRGLEWLKTEDGIKLELDGYNSGLKLGFEHQGEQHYSDASQYPRSKYDSLKRQLCKKNKVILIEIPQLTTRTKLKNLPKFLHKALTQSGFDIDPKSIEQINYTSAYRFSEHEELVKRGKEIGFTLLSPNSVIPGERYQWKCMDCGIQIERTIYDLEHAGCQKCHNLKRIGPIDGHTNISTLLELSEVFDLYYPTVTRLGQQEGMSGQQIVDHLLGDIRKPSKHPITQLSFHWDDVWYKNKNEALQALGISQKALESFRLRRGLSFESALPEYLSENNKKSFLVFSHEFKTKKEVYNHTLVSEGKVNRLLKEHPELTFEQAVEELAIEFEGEFFVNLKELAQYANVKYMTLVQRMGRNQTSHYTEIKYLRKKASSNANKANS